MKNSLFENSPKWSTTTKLVVALALVAILAGIVVRFNTILGPLMISFMLAYLINPAANFLKVKLRFSWNIAVGIIYLFLIIILLGLLTLGGLAIFEQLTSLIKFIQVEIVNVPTFLENLSNQKYVFGPFEIDFSQLDLVQLGNQILSMVQPIISRLGTLVGSLAAGTASTIGWIFFAVLISYFILAETKGVSGEILKFSIPGYDEDIKNMGLELNRIWNAFFRGQLLIYYVDDCVLHNYVRFITRQFLFWSGNHCRASQVCTLCWSCHRLDDIWFGRIVSGYNHF